MTQFSNVIVNKARNDDGGFLHRFPKTYKLTPNPSLRGGTTQQSKVSLLK